MTEPTARELEFDEARDAWLRAAEAELSHPGLSRERRSPTHGAQEAG
jgi:hypothetical protein